MTNREAVVFFQGLAETDPDGVARLPKAKKEAGVCWCGCGGATKGRFVPGHDARFHSTAKKAMRGEVDQDEALEALAHDEAREHFLEFQEKIRPREEARARLKVEEAKLKELAKATKEAPVEEEELEVA